MSVDRMLRGKNGVGEEAHDEEVSLISNSNLNADYDTVEIKKRTGSLPACGGQRYVLVALLFTVGTLCYIVRTNMGIIVGDINQDDFQTGLILSAFFYGYICTQIPGSFLTRRIGVKSVLLIGMMVWTIFDMSTVPASSNFYALIFVRIGVGFGQGVVFPCNHCFSGAWLPLEEKSLLVSIMSSGMDFGTIASLIITPQIEGNLGWQYVPLIYGCCTLVLVGVITLLASSTPEQNRFITSDELSIIASGRQNSKTVVPTPWMALFRSKSLWAIVAAHIGNNYGWYVLLSWIPKDNPLVAAAPYFTGLLMMQFGGWLSDVLIIRLKFRTVVVRKMMALLSTCIPAVFLLLMWVPSTAFGTTLMLCGAVGFSRFSINSYWVNMLDIAPGHAGELMAFSNTLGTIPGIVGNTITGSILSATGSWTAVFSVTAVVYLIGGIIFVIFADDRPVVAAQKGHEDVECDTQ